MQRERACGGTAGRAELLLLLLCAGVVRRGCPFRQRLWCSATPLWQPTHGTRAYDVRTTPRFRCLQWCRASAWRSACASSPGTYHATTTTSLTARFVVFFLLLLLP